MKGFRDFLMRGNLVDLAVAVVIGVAFNAVVQALIADIITPLIAAIFHQPDFSKLTFTVNGSTFTYGLFINALISFIIIAAVIYFLVVTPVNKLMAIAIKKKEATDRQCPECLSTIPIAARKCMYCTSDVPPVAPAAPVAPVS